MERQVPPADGSAASTLPTRAWLIGVAALLAWHAWLTLALFGDYPWSNLYNDAPVMSGVHGQHLYLGKVGSEAIMEYGRTAVFDIRFQALYPKTPIFDGARLGELFLLCGGGSYQPAAYKIGFACLCMLVPIFLLAACYGLGVGHGTTLLATFLGELIWWGPHGRAALVTGDCELYLASLSVLAHIGFLAAFHRTASVTSWFGLLMTGAVGWFLQPLFLPIVLPVLLIYYLSVGAKHELMSWHVAFWSVEVLTVLINLPWLGDWLDSWWLRTPLPLATDLLAHRTFATIWNAPIWGGSTSRLLAMVVTVGGAAGVVILNQSRERPAARMLGLAATGCLTLSLLGISWEPLGVVGTAALLAPALWFACIPAALAAVWVSARLWQGGALRRWILAGLLLTGGSAFVVLTDTPATLPDRLLPTEPLEIGLGPGREAIVQTLIDYTTDDARILWEDLSRSRHASRWAALLPILTERSYIGGLDPDGFIEHSRIGLRDHFLESNLPFTAAKDTELNEYCRRYNVRWIVAWSPPTIDRLERWKDAEKRARLVDDNVGWLFEVKRKPNFALKGQADLLTANGQNIELANVVPHNGEVLISLHYQAGMRASPSRVQIERATSDEDSIGFVRLRLAVPAARVTLSWDR